MTTFDALGVAPKLVTALAAGGIVEPLPIQALTIADALAGRDVCGKAKTGSGKTLAFGLPLIMRTPKSSPGRPRGLVLVPTRELAVQVRDVLAPLAQACGVRLTAIYGGAPTDRQIKALERGVDIVVATPGRLIDLGNRGDLSVDDVEFLVLDEADRMVDMGFMPQVEWVLRRLPDKHQTLLFSATLEADVERLVRNYVTDPVTHEVESDTPTVEAMDHRFLRVHEMDKVKVAAAIAQTANRTLVFVRTKRGADRLVRQFRRESVTCGVLHGDLAQGARTRAMGQFRSGEVKVLVATDIAARGLDVEGVDFVLHYDPPEDERAYLHRSGRTARAGETGMAVSLLLWNQVVDAERLCTRLGINQQITEMFSNDERLTDLGAWEPPVATVAPAEAATGTEGAPARPRPVRRPPVRRRGRRR